MKLKERDCKRSMDILVREYPNKTGAEITAIYEQDIQEYNNYVARINKKKLERVQWLKDNPYIRIKYHKMTTYLHITYAEFKYDEVIFSCIKSSISSNSIINGEGYSVNTKEKEKLCSWHNWYTGNEELTVLTKEQYDEWHNKIDLLAL